MLRPLLENDHIIENKSDNNNQNNHHHHHPMKSSNIGTAAMNDVEEGKRKVKNNIHSAPPPASAFSQFVSSVVRKNNHGESYDVERTRYDESLLMHDDDSANVNHDDYNHRNNTLVRGEYRSMVQEDGDAEASRIRKECSLFYEEVDERDVNVRETSFSSFALMNGGEGQQPLQESLPQHNYVPHRDSSSRSVSTANTTAAASFSTIYDVAISGMNKNVQKNHKGAIFDSITINAEDFSTSSLFEKDKSGQLKNYKLPTDNIRLAVIPNVQSGILSMVVGGNSSSRSIPGKESSLSDTEIAENIDKKKCSWGSVSYILTVEEDLYKRVVTEMADSLQSPFNLYNCCRDSGSVDIRIALLILSVFFLFLFISTMVWPTQ